jgi:insertion element IS1 protein InsB
VEVVIRWTDEAEMDEMGSYVQRKKEPRWLWHAIDHRSSKVLAYVFGRRKDEVFLKLKALLEPFGITRYYTDDWGAYTRHLDADEHQPGKRNTQKIEVRPVGRKEALASGQTAS